MVSDVYSNKDSNRNRKIELKQSHILIGIVGACLLALSTLGAIHYHKAYEANNLQSTAPVEPPAIVSDQAHNYVATVPPYKQ
jgi:hypothetical protein